MKKLILLSLFLFWSGNVISQNVTKQKEQKDTVSIPLEVARFLGSELVLYDVCVQERNILKENLELMQKKDIVKDTIIENLKKQNSNYKLMDEKHQENIVIKDNIILDYKNQVKKKTNNGIVYKAIIVLLSGALIIK